MKTWIHEFELLILMTLTLISLVGCNSSKEPYTVRKQRVRGNVRVAVINASGVNGLARRVTFWLRGMGYDVLYYGSDTSTLEKTVIIDHVNRNKKYGKMLGGTVGCGNIIYEPDPDSLFDVTVVIGRDYKKYFKEAAQKRLIY